MQNNCQGTNYKKPLIMVNCPAKQDLALPDQLLIAE